MIDESLMKKFREIQKRIADKVVLDDRFKLNKVAGFDLAFHEDKIFCAGVVLRYETLEVIEEKTLAIREAFPYVPTFLAFREAPAIIRTYMKLENKPDVVMINGHGIAHPLFCGIASHVGVLLKGPATIGVAGSKLCGEYDKAPKAEGEWSALKYRGKVVGAVLLTRRGCKPIFVSPGHKISLKSSVEIVKHFVTSYRLPLPLQLAHHLANSERLKFEAALT